MANNYEEFTEQDWKLFRSKIGKWQEAYMERLNKEYIQILSSDKSSAERFWTIEKRIKEDKKKPGVLIEIRRSIFIENILRMLQDETITLEDLEDFSDTFKETIHFYVDRWEQ